MGEQGSQQPHKCPLEQEKNSCSEQKKGCGELYNWGDRGHLSSKWGPTLHGIPYRTETDTNPKTSQCNDLDSEGFCENGEGSLETMGRDTPVGWSCRRAGLGVQRPHRVWRGGPPNSG